MTSFPGSIKTFATLADLADSVLAAHQNERGDEITAVETYLLNLGAGWIACSETWTRTGDYTFTVSGDVTAKYRKGAKVRYKDGGSFEYGVVLSSSYSAPNTTVTLITNSDYAMAAATITDTYISYSDNPEGFPVWFNFEISLANVTVGNGTLVAKFMAKPGKIDIDIYFSLGSTSAIGGDVTFTPPVTIVNYTTTHRQIVGYANINDSGSVANAVPIINSSLDVALRYLTVSGASIVQGVINATSPFTWATNDRFSMFVSLAW